MSKSRSFKATAVALFAVILLLGTPTAHARSRGDDPVDPIARVVHYIKHIFTIITHDSGITPPHP